MAAALGYRHDHTGTMQARLCFHLQQPSHDSDRLITVLEQLAGFYAGQRVVLIWDGLSAHWSTKMRAWLDSQRDWLRAERLPAYAPELNAVEYLWANLKDLELGESAHDQPGRGRRRTEQGLQRICKSDSLIVGFLAHTGLSLDP
jgi:transposase